MLRSHMYIHNIYCENSYNHQINTHTQVNTTSCIEINGNHSFDIGLVPEIQMTNHFKFKTKDKSCLILHTRLSFDYHIHILQFAPIKVRSH